MKRALLLVLVLLGLATGSAFAAVKPVVCGSEGCGASGGNGRPDCNWSTNGMWWNSQWCGIYPDEQGPGAYPHWH